METTKTVIYESSDAFDPHGTPIHFHRVICHTSYEDNSFVRDEIWLPENWNGIFIGLGNGGMAGDFWYADLLKYTRLGYATAQSDLGTSRGETCGIHNPAVWKDFGWRATHGMTVLGKEIIEEHYGRKPDFSYFSGISTGGQQAISEVQRFPEDYDGVIAGVPANNRIALHTYFLWNHNHLRTRDGQLLFTREEIGKLTALAAKFFQSMGDGEPGDHFVTYPWKGPDTVQQFLLFLKANGYREVQLNALEAVYTGPTDPATGKQIYNGMPIGSENFGGGILECMSPESPHFYPFKWAFGADYDGYDFDFSKDYRKISEILALDMSANVTDLTPFKKNGCRLIAFSGTADPCVPFPDAQSYYERVMSEMGGYDETASFFRYFIFPGKDHTDGGSGSNREWGDETGKLELIDVIRAWCEKGKAPEYLVAARKEEENVVFARKIYPYGSENYPAREGMKTCEVF